MIDEQLKSEIATRERFQKQQDRIVSDFGHGDTEGSMGIARTNLKKLSTFISKKIEEAKQNPETTIATFCRAISDLDPDVVALSSLCSMLTSIGAGGSRLRTFRHIGQDIAGELWAAGLLKTNRSLVRKINTAVRKRHGKLSYRKQAARSLAARFGNYRSKVWNVKEHIEAGGMLAGWIMAALPDVFEEVSVEGKVYFTITEKAVEIAKASVEAAMRRNPVLVPCLQPPKPWTALYAGGYWDERSHLNTAAVRTFRVKEREASIRAAFRNGGMQSHLQGLNRLQGVAWKINKPILELIQACEAEGMSVSGIPNTEKLPPPPFPRPWDNMTQDERRLWKHRADRIEAYNRTQIGQSILFTQDLETAKGLAEAERFYTPMNCDWRGRVYGVSHFNFQRDDRVRALFLFADGEPLGEDGLYWLKVHCANCGDFDKISKQPYDARAAWVDANMEKIFECVGSPLSASAKSFWTEADTPFLFLAACRELVMVVRSQNPTSFITHLPVSFDGSCSGLQHLCAMTRAPEGSLVNLTNSPTPQDVYQTVADRVEKAIRENAEGVGLSAQRVDKEGNKIGLSPSEQVELAKLCLKFGITRKVVKRNVMTYAYSSKKYGMAKQQDEDLIDPLTFEVISGVIDRHPFGRFGYKPHPNATSQAAMYIAEKTYTAIQETVSLPEQAMTFLRKCAKAMAHEGKPLMWTTPTGLPWSNIYRVPNVKRVELWMHDKRVTVSYIDGATKTIDKDKAANGVAPNFVHALDAAHLMLTVNAAFEEGITQLATVHDSFGCLASRAGRFQKIIREQFVRMYEEHDVLTEVLTQAKCDLTQHNRERLPSEFQYGDLELREVLSAPYAFA